MLSPHPPTAQALKPALPTARLCGPAETVVVALAFLDLPEYFCLAGRAEGRSCGVILGFVVPLLAALDTFDGHICVHSVPVTTWLA